MLKHGYCYEPEYTAWCNAVARCHRVKHPRYKDWGARGVTVCDEWHHNFAAFLAHVGTRPGPRYSLDRIDGKRGYEPGNVRWATATEQSGNRPSFVRRIPYAGEVLCMSELARRVGINRETLKYRLDHGWSLESAVSP